MNKSTERGERNKTLIRIVYVFVLFYRTCISPLLPSSCRFYPSCSEYAMQAVEKHGVIKGIFKGMLRVLRCHPFSRGGTDFP